MINIKVIILLILIIPLVLLSFVLQVFLSLQKNKWMGLILPILSLFVAAFLSFGTMIYMGEIAPIIMAFILLSIPAMINFVIYSICRVKVKEKNNKELEKMNIQDLD